MEFLTDDEKQIITDVVKKNKLKEEKRRKRREQRRMKILEKRIKKLPKNLFHILNLDKGYHEKWGGKKLSDGTFEADDLLNFPMPTRFCLFGRPNSGKTSVIKHLIMRQWEPFKKIYLLHADPRSVEYDDVNVEKLDKVPEISHFDPAEKSAFIMEDIAFGKLSGGEMENLDRILGYCSTHAQVCPIITAQRSFRIPKNIRDMVNVWIIFKMKDQLAIKMIAKQIGLDGDKLCSFINNLDEKKYESLWIDETPNSPAPFRFCGYQPVDFF